MYGNTHATTPAPFLDRIDFNPDDSVTLRLGPGDMFAPRKSMQLASMAMYWNGLFIFDMPHMPSGFGLSPWLWLMSANWPNNGSIGLVNGVHNAVQNTINANTRTGCTMGTEGYSGSFLMTKHIDQSLHGDCQTNQPGQPNTDAQGCGILSPDTSSFGAAWNAKGGGVIALDWSENGITVWQWNKANVPADITAGHPIAGSDGWGTPVS